MDYGAVTCCEPDLITRFYPTLPKFRRSLGSRILGFSHTSLAWAFGNLAHRIHGTGIFAYIYHTNQHKSTKCIQM